MRLSGNVQQLIVTVQVLQICMIAFSIIQKQKNIPLIRSMFRIPRNILQPIIEIRIQMVVST